MDGLRRIRHGLRVCVLLVAGIPAAALAGTPATLEREASVVRTLLAQPLPVDRGDARVVSEELDILREYQSSKQLDAYLKQRDLSRMKGELDERLTVGQAAAKGVVDDVHYNDELRRFFQEKVVVDYTAADEGMPAELVKPYVAPYTRLAPGLFSPTSPDADSGFWPNRLYFSVRMSNRLATTVRVRSRAFVAIGDFVNCPTTDLPPGASILLTCENESHESYAPNVDKKRFDGMLAFKTTGDQDARPRNASVVTTVTTDQPPNEVTLDWNTHPERDAAIHAKALAALSSLGCDVGSSGCKATGAEAWLSNAGGSLCLFALMALGSVVVRHVAIAHGKPFGFPPWLFWLYSAAVGFTGVVTALFGMSGNAGIISVLVQYFVALPWSKVYNASGGTELLGNADSVFIPFIIVNLVYLALMTFPVSKAPEGSRAHAIDES